MKTNLLIFLLMSLYFGCSKAPKTTAKFNLRSLSNLDASINDISENGIVIFGTNDNGHRFAKVMNAGDNFDYELDNGLWTFKAVAWDEGNPTLPPVADTIDPNRKFMGTPSCAKTNVDLNGSEAVINLSLKNSDCTTEDFSAGTKSYDNSGLKVFYPLMDIYSCDESVGDGSTVTLGSKCLNDFAQYAANSGDDTFLNRGYHSSYKIVAKSFYAGSGSTALNVGSATISSTCLTANDTASGAANGLAALSNLQIPSGSGLSFSVEAYYTENCSGRKNEYILNDGLATSGGKIGVTDTVTPSERQTLYLRSFATDVCQGAGLTNDYAGGNGSEGKPYLICTPNQLNKMYDLTAVPYTKNYRLVRPIDMNNSTFHADQGNIISSGKNFKPLGYRENDASMASGTCGNAATNAIQFSGNFDGGSNAIKNLKMEAFKAFDGQHCDNTGLFAYSSNAKFARMKFENIEIDQGLSFTGILVGNAFNTNIYGVDVQGATINVDNSVLAISPIIGDLLGASSYENVNFNGVQINSLITPLTNISQTATGLCEGGGTISLNGAGIDTGPDTATCSSGSFNIATTLTAADGQKDFTITHPNGSTVNASYLFDNPNPTVTDVYTAKPDGTYGVSEVIDILIQFSENVTVTGTPELALNAGGVSSADYFSGSGSNLLTFRYTVAATENSADLDYLNTTSLTLNGGSIVGLAAADLTLPTPGGVNSISDDKAIIISTSAVNGTISINTPAIISSGNVASYTLSGTCSPDGTNIIDLDIDSGAVTQNNISCSAGSWTHTFDISAAADNPSLNLAANYGTGNNSQTVTKDTFSPAPTLTSPTSGDYVNNATVTMTGTCETGSNVLINGGDVVADGSGTCGAGAYSLSVTFLAGDGVKNFDITQTDVYGNISSTLSGNFNLDTTAPSVTITNFPHINSSNQASYNISGSCSENSEIVNVNIGGVVSNPVCAANAWSTVIDASGIADGASVTLTADTVDLAGNTAAQASQLVIKDTVIPNIVSVTDFTNAPPYLDGQNVTIRIIFSEQVEISGSASLELNISNLAGSNQANSVTTTLNSFHDFDYIVDQYQVTTELDYNSSTSLTIAGAIQDAAGNNLNNILPNPGPGNTGSLSNSNPGIVVLGGNSFDSTWDTDIVSPSGTGFVQLPLVTGLAYDFIVEWSPGVYEHITSDTITAYNYGSGIQNIKIYGKFPSMRFNNGGDKDKLLAIPGLGNVGWETFENSFYGCSNLTTFDGGGGDTSMVTSMQGMFRNAILATPNTSGWITSAVTDMSYMFDGAASANPDVSGWDTSLVTNMSYMFRSASVANPDVSNWNTAAVTNMSRMFDNADSATPVTTTAGNIWNTSNVTEMISMFDNAALANPDVLGWDVSNVQNMSSMFRDAPSAAPLVGPWDTSSVTNMSFMFEGNTIANPQVDSWDVSSVTDMRNMFDGATNALPNMSSWNFSSVTNLDGFLDNNAGLNNLMYTNFLVAVQSSASPGNLSGVIINTPAQYQAAATAAHADLISTFGWTMNDAGPQ